MFWASAGLGAQNNIQIFSHVFKLYLFTLTEHMSGGEGQREREKERENKRERENERIWSKHHPVSTEFDVGLKLMSPEIMTWAEPKCRTCNQLSHPGVSDIQSLTFWKLHNNIKNTYKRSLRLNGYFSYYIFHDYTVIFTLLLCPYSKLLCKALQGRKIFCM